jgi:membrane-associated phospholipid phosphatase
VKRVLHPRGLLLLAAGCFFSVSLGVLLLGALPADAAARDTLLALASPTVVAAMHVATSMGHARFLVPATLLLLAVFPEARARWWVWAGLMIVAPITESTLKIVIARPRPFDPSFGFPSGHATAAAAFFGALMYLAGSLRPPARTVVRALAVVAIIVVALSRVILRAHWPSDVLGGVALGLALASAAALLAELPRPAPAGAS